MEDSSPARIYLLVPDGIVYRSPWLSAVARNTTRLDSPDGESYAGKYPREAKVKPCKVPRHLFGKDGENENDGQSNVTADYL
jgi:hypothetical protein